MKKIVVLSGSGISVESGIPTFRDADGLWEGYDVTKVASPEGWESDPHTVLKFYNERRKKLLEVQPNAGHEYLARLEKHYEVVVITQNIDDLHEQAGSSQVVHLHGELKKARSTVDENLVYDIEGERLNWGDTCEKGSQLRPHVVWFGEMVPMMEVAISHAMSADIFVVVGTSLQVYPAAGLMHYTPEEVPLYVIDPKIPYTAPRENVYIMRETASKGMEKLFYQLVNPDQ